MVKVILKYTGEIIEVQNNEAHDLIEAGKAKLFTGAKPTPYKTRVMVPGKKKYGYRIK